MSTRAHAQLPIPATRRRTMDYVRNSAVSARMLAVALSMIALSASADSGLMLFQGQVQRQTLFPVGTAQCPRLCLSENRLAPPQDPGGKHIPKYDAMLGVCAADTGECWSADVQVLRAFVGTRRSAVEHLEGRKDDRASFVMNNSDVPQLVLVLAKNVYSTTLETRHGADAVNINFIEGIDGLDIETFHPDADGKVLLSELISKLTP